jgi:putative transposase
MPRPLRLEFEDACYHVMNRGAGFRNIFEDKEHRLLFLEILAEAKQLYGIEIHAYCLMDNHYHLLLRTPRANLGRAMRHINGVYTQRFNRLVNSDGPLFRGRYKAIIVDDENYLLQVSRYIHLNPISAKLIKKIEKYEWSSYSSYLEPNNKPSWLNVDEILLIMDERNGAKKYKQFIEDGLDEETEKFYGRSNLPMILGDKKFKDKLLKTLDKKQILSSRSDYNNTRCLPSMKEVNGACANYFKLAENELYVGQRGKRNDPRKIAIYGCRVWACERLATIAAQYGCNNYTIVSNIVREMKRRMKTEKKLYSIMSKVQKQLGC